MSLAHEGTSGAEGGCVAFEHIPRRNVVRGDEVVDLSGADGRRGSRALHYSQGVRLVAQGRGGSKAVYMQRCVSGALVEMGRPRRPPRADPCGHVVHVVEQDGQGRSVRGQRFRAASTWPRPPDAQIWLRYRDSAVQGAFHPPSGSVIHGFLDMPVAPSLGFAAISGRHRHGAAAALGVTMAIVATKRRWRWLQSLLGDGRRLSGRPRVV